MGINVSIDVVDMECVGMNWWTIIYITVALIWSEEKRDKYAKALADCEYGDACVAFMERQKFEHEQRGVN